MAFTELRTYSASVKSNFCNFGGTSPFMPSLDTPPVTVTVTGTAGVKKSLLGLDSWIAAAEEVSLQTASEGGKRRCRRDVLRQTVPNTGCSDCVPVRPTILLYNDPSPWYAY